MNRTRPLGNGPLISMILVCRLTATQSELPEGKGKDAVESTCTACHTVQRIQEQHLDEERWRGIIREMTEKGASINPDDRKVILDYLTKNFGPEANDRVNINKASADRISAVLRLTSLEAETIVQYRAKNGNFKDLNDLEKIAGLAEKIEAKKACIEF